MPKLSIIVPIYNVEKYLKRCIDSILSQMYTDFEAILIDDGSPDQCGRIIDEYAKIDGRIVAIHQKNKGVSAARNAGLQAARGEYIGFVDPDDWIEPDMYSVLLGIMDSERGDIASCSWIDNEENGVETPYSSGLSSALMSREEYMKHLFDMPPTIAGSACTKVIRRDIIRSDFLEKYAICEDNHFVAQCCVNVKRAVYVNKPLYHIFLRQNSTTRKEPGKVVLGLAARRDIIGIAKRVNKECTDKAELLFLDQCIHFCDKLKNDEYNYRSIARKEFLTYIKSKPLCIVTNNAIPLKQKVYFLLKYLVLLIEKS